MGVYWALSAAVQFPGCIEILDLRTLLPLDEDLVFSAVKRHGKCLVLTEEPEGNSFSLGLAARISMTCFTFLDAPVSVLGAMNLPALPLNLDLEKAALPNAGKVATAIRNLLKN
ncbi:MAG: transketolase C-terminal domain-containing protein [Chitinophagaceae bacterium]